MSSEPESMKQTLERLTSAQVVIVQPVATLSVGRPFPGMYIMISGLSLNVLWRRRSSAASRVHVRWIIILFILININNAAGVWIYVCQTLVAFDAATTKNYVPLHQFLSVGTSTSRQTAQLGLSMFSSIIIGIIMTYLLVHRCYVIWGYCRSILYLFGFIVCVTNSINLVVTGLMIAAYHRHDGASYHKNFRIVEALAIVTTAYASLLTFLTAARIWWLSRQTCKIARMAVGCSYKMIVVAILESGLLYSIALVLTAVLPQLTSPNGEVTPFYFNGIAIQLAAIAPTLMIVRIASGQPEEGAQERISTLQFAEATNGSQRQSIDAQDTVELRQSLTGLENRIFGVRSGTEKSLSNTEESIEV
ncbi:hypothetical protein PM082_004514 [Marasmius tenuissimus]|nr:hypothetical protein PM082_004514 [Marasmius tenuissimus]